jgi:putative membrane-bound dehydrogenase-like protein
MRLSLLCLLALPFAALAADDFPVPFNTEKTPGGPMSAEETAATMQLPPGFKCQVFASEPDVQQPIAMAWDAKGRLWIAENYTYAENPMRWDTKLRDRIVIFEDKDNDGKQDGRKVFWDKGAYLTSVEVGYGGVWILHNGTLSFIADKNGDDVPDGEPEVLLDGFNVKTIGHNIVNGLRWGPDGWLYGRHGITDTSAVGAPGTPMEKRTKLNCSIWRYHPTRKVFEVVLHGGTNSWGHDWDANGELFWINTVIGHLFHGIPGSYTDRMFGTHLNSHVYETLPMIADHYHFDIGNEKWSDIRTGISNKTSELGGGHAHVGMMIYNGGTWPKEYQGKVFTCNLHGNRINMDILEREGCGFVAKHGPDFMKAKDKWFRGIDLSTGPDGNVFVLDWSDAGECHDNDGVHRTSGRIYKIVYGEKKKAERSSSNNWWSRVDLQQAYEKAPPAPVPLPTIADAASNDGLNRLHLASALQRLPLEARFPIATALASRAEDANDKQQPLMIWYGIEPAVMAHPDMAIALALSSKIPTVRRLITRRLAEEIEKTPEPIDKLLAAAIKARNDGILPSRKTDGEMPSLPVEDIIRGMSAALKGFSQVAKPKHWDEFAKAARGASTDALRDLNLVFGSGRAADELIALVNNQEGDANARRSAFDSLMRNPKPDQFGFVRGLINDKVLGTAARSALAKFGNDDVPKALLNTWPDRSIEWRAANVTTLVSRPAWTKALLETIAAGKIKRDEISPFQARQIRSQNDPALNDLLTQVWGELHDTPEAKKAVLAKWQKSLSKDALSKADAAKGKVLFSAVCASCHKLYGEGAALGPDLTGSDRHNLDYLLGNIVDPNAMVPADYRVSVLKLKDGRTLTGVLPEQTDRTLTLQTPTERLTIERSQIAEQQQLPASLMPEGLLEALGEENVRNLIAYLMK